MLLYCIVLIKIRGMYMLTVLFLCTGNTCRSPMAQMILQHKVQEAGLEDKINVISAGMGTFVGLPLSLDAKRALQRLEYPVQEHSSQPLTQELAEKADLILTMTRNHWYLALRTFPFVEDKIYTLAEFCGEDADVSDPFGLGESAYFWCASQLTEMLDKAFIKIKQEVEG